MPEQPSDWQTPSPQPPPTPAVDTSEPMTSVQTQIGLVLTAAAAVVAFVFHKDFSSLVPPLSVLAFAVYGAAVAIARAWKHSTVIKAQTQVQSLALETWATNRRDTTAANVVLLDHRLRTVEQTIAAKPAVKKAVAKKTTRSRRKPPPY